MRNTHFWSIITTESIDTRDFSTGSVLGVLPAPSTGGRRNLSLSVGTCDGQPVQKIMAKTSALVKHCQALPIPRRHSIG